MSHFSRITTKFRHKQALVQCLQDMGYTVEMDTTIKGYHGLHNVDIAVNKIRGYGIGFVKNSNGTYDMLADWWGIAGTGQKKISDELQHRAELIQKEYAKKIVLEQAKMDGFDVVSQTEDADGSVRIVVRRWA